VIRREHDTELIDRISNSPHVRPFICYRDGALDWWPAIRGCCVLSNGEDAIGIFEETRERVWQVHTLFDATCRGRRAIETAREMVEWMMPRFADVIWGATPESNPAARWFNRQLGAEVIGHDVYEAEGPVELFALREVH
jgi:hypothetical protein